MYSHFLRPGHSKNIIRKYCSGRFNFNSPKNSIVYSERLPQLTNLFWLSSQEHVTDEEQQINASNQVGGKDCIPVSSTWHHNYPQQK